MVSEKIIYTVIAMESDQNRQSCPVIDMYGCIYDFDKCTCMVHTVLANTGHFADEPVCQRLLCQRMKSICQHQMSVRQRLYATQLLREPT